MKLPIFTAFQGRKQDLPLSFLLRYPVNRHLKNATRGIEANNVYHQKNPRNRSNQFLQLWFSGGDNMGNGGDGESSCWAKSLELL